MIRTGIGTDVHRFAPGVPMWLAGLHFPDEQAGLAGIDVGQLEVGRLGETKRR